MTGDKQYLVTKVHRDGSSGRGVMPFEKIADYIKTSLTMGARVTIEEL